MRTAQEAVEWLAGKVEEAREKAGPLCIQSVLGGADKLEWQEAIRRATAYETLSHAHCQLSAIVSLEADADIEPKTRKRRKSK